MSLPCSTPYGDFKSRADAARSIIEKGFEEAFHRAYSKTDHPNSWPKDTDQRVLDGQVDARMQAIVDTIIVLIQEKVAGWK
jgi:hypothetical protein